MLCTLAGEVKSISRTFTNRLEVDGPTTKITYGRSRSSGGYERRVSAERKDSRSEEQLYRYASVLHQVMVNAAGKPLSDYGRQVKVTRLSFISEYGLSLERVANRIDEPWRKALTNSMYMKSFLGNNSRIVRNRTSSSRARDTPSPAQGNQAINSSDVVLKGKAHDNVPRSRAKF